jgi:hypothetical protein
MTPTSLASNPGTWTDSACFDHKLSNCTVIVTVCSASHLRQSILLSSYETPEIRSLFNKKLKNVAGKIRTEAVWAPVQVPEGIQQVCSELYAVSTVHIDYSLQNFMKFECASAKDELNKRFEFFTTHVGPRNNTRDVAICIREIDTLIPADLP